MEFQERRSEIDASVNYTAATEDGGMIECRFVQRDANAAIIYVSSATGCARSCRMCWLTQTGQTMQRNLTFDELEAQVRQVARHPWFLSGSYGKRASISFMARGEPMDNPTVVSAHHMRKLKRMVSMPFSIKTQVKISTIMPTESDLWGLDGKRTVFDEETNRIYYSLYSTFDGFRKRWLPKTLPVAQALDMLAQCRAEIVIHGAFIEQENDSEHRVDSLIDTVNRHFQKAQKPWRFNMVRFNPIDGSPYRESPRLNEIEDQFMRMGIPFKRITRVGPDVQASCGMFVNEG